MYVDIDSKKFKKIYGVKVIENMINNILKTRKGTIPFKREFGTDLETYLFEPYSFITLKLMEDTLIRDLSINLPNDVIIKKISGQFDPDTEIYEFMINFYIQSLEELNTFNIFFNKKG